MTMEYSELINRRKVFSISPQALLAAYQEWDVVQKLEIPDAKGAVVHEVFYDPLLRMFRFILMREDWPEARPGTIPEEIQTTAKTICRTSEGLQCVK